MLLDLFAQDNYVSFNIKLAHILGLREAIYVNQILNITGKAIKKDKVKEGFIQVDRNYVYERTTLTIEDQLIIDAKLEQIKALSRDFDNPDLIKLDENILASLLSTDDVEALKEINLHIKKDTKALREAKKEGIVRGLCAAIQCQDMQLNNALCGWVRAIIKSKNSFLTKPLVADFETKLYNYTRGDVASALEIVNIATLYCYRDITWAFKKYEAEKRELKTTQPVSDFTGLSKKKF